MINRKRIGPAESYRGHKIEARHMGPDLLCYVNGQQVGHYYADTEAAKRAGRRYIDDREREAQKG